MASEVSIVAKDFPLFCSTVGWAEYLEFWRIDGEGRHIAAEGNGVTRVGSFGMSRPAVSPKPVAEKSAKEIMEALCSQISLTHIVEVFQPVHVLPHGGIKCVCPFHDDHHPSMVINEHPEHSVPYFHCFVCGAHGDMLSFVAKMQGWTMKAAFKRMMVFIGQGGGPADVVRWVESLGPVSTHRPQTLPRTANSAPRPPAAKTRTVPPTVLSAAPPSLSPTQSERLLGVLDLASLHFASTLLQDPRTQAVRDYLSSRYLSNTTIAAFRVGLAHDSPQKSHSSTRSTPSLLTHLRIMQGLSVPERQEYKDFHTTTRPFDEADLMQVGLLANSSSSGRVYERFRNRLMVPILDPASRVVGFGGRELPEHVVLALGGRPSTLPSPGKYINSPASAVFRKGTLLFGVPQAEAQCRAKRQVLVVEGYFDVLSLHEIGVHHCVASMGTALTADQLRLAAKLCGGNGTVVLVLDNDAAGQAAIARAAKIAEKLTQGTSAPDRVQLKAVSWETVAKYIRSQAFAIRREQSAELIHIKDCGDLCELLSKEDAYAVVQHLVSRSKSIGTIGE